MATELRILQYRIWKAKKMAERLFIALATWDFGDYAFAGYCASYESVRWMRIETARALEFADGFSFDPAKFLAFPQLREALVTIMAAALLMTN